MVSPEVDDFRAPNRKPWLLLIVVAVVGLFFLLRSRTDRSTPAEERDDAQPVPEEMAHREAEEVSPERPPPVVHTGDVKTLVERAAAFADAGELLQARRLYSRILAGQPLLPSTQADIEKRLGDVNVRLVMSPAPMPEKTDYVVQRGDSIARLAKRFGTTVGLIQAGNGISDPNLIKVGDRLRIFSGDFAISVDRSRNELLVTLNGSYFKRYRVGTGKFEKTPIGTFKITEKIKEPVWWRPDGKEVPFGDPENILGTRWMTLRSTGDTADVRGYGIHGTWDDSSIGKSESAGCVRMRNPEVEELYTLIPVGTPVTITE